ncbi:hypothetical protein [Prevotella sp. OH937_COT-195]|uniref:hypothetical protein n=1 Tax=Prevotella sp. OH937_COT-195 TaxID=2491051 RepID=UPI000FC3543D|nr:hypothetical protein [Prevotella sp. OH937_COT-195]RRC97016.1 hypothetical protein EII32_10815 [Prevotella sp. OH937_COT-195]
MKKLFLKLYWLIVAIILVWCIISKCLSVPYSLGSQSKYTDDWLFFMDTLLPDVVSLIAYVVLLCECIKKIGKRIVIDKRKLL